jgi:CRP-like cAMP-binding protein
VFFWINDAGRMERIRTACAERMWYALARAGIEMSYPNRNVVMRTEAWDSGPPPEPGADGRRVARNLALLRAVPALATLSSDALERLAASMRDETYCDGERITHEGVRGDRMYFVVEGAAKALVGRAADHEVKTVGAGEYFGERGMLTGAPRAATFAAAGTLRVASLAASDVQPVLRERPEFAEQMATLVAERKHHLDELTDKAAADAGKTTKASEHSTLLDEIAGFFHLPRHHRRGDGPRP